METIHDFVQEHILERIDEEFKNYDHDVRCLLTWYEDLPSTLENSGWNIAQVDDEYIIYSDYFDGIEIYQHYEGMIKSFSWEEFQRIEKSNFEGNSGILIDNDDLFLAMKDLVIKDDLEIIYDEAQEFFRVSDFLAEKLIKKGEKITYSNIWSRVTNNQQVTQDESIKEIFQEVKNG